MKREGIISITEECRYSWIKAQNEESKPERKGDFLELNEMGICLEI